MDTLQLKKKVLILGSKGMLGQALMGEFGKNDDYAVTGWDREELDLTYFDALEKAVTELAPTIVLNAAAYNAVDTCEEDGRELAKAVSLNVKLPEKLAELSKKLDFILVHYSTDSVFDGALETSPSRGCGSGACCGGGCHGDEETGYAEDALPNPLSKYGETKLGGEEGVKRNAEKWYVIRLSRLFGQPGTSAIAKKSFFDAMLEKGKREKEVQVVDAEKSCFTYAPDLAVATRELIEAVSPFGIYHLPNTGGATWYEAARELYRLANLPVSVRPVSPLMFPRPAQRPAFSVLLNTKRPPLRPYTAALEDYLSGMVQ